MDKTEEELLKTQVKRYKIVDVLIFLLAIINLILWLIRANYVTGFYQSDFSEWIYTNFYQPMYYALFLVPIALIISLFNRKFSVDSFTFLTLKTVVINYILIFILVYFS